MENKLKFVITGHIDHGKSTLIGRLLYDTNSLPEGAMEEIENTAKALGKKMEFAHILDHLEEERERGITIDTAQTFFKTKKREYVIIDAPGHKEFLKNMITGASQAEAAILMVDLNEGIKEQTKRHAYILTLLGIKQLIVAMNKMDLINYSQEKFEQVKKELMAFLDSINVKPTYIIPVSAFLGENIANRAEKISFYSGPTILEALDTFEKTKSADEKQLIFPVQDVYNISGKNIAAGRVESGKINAGEQVIVLPENMEIKINTVEKFLENAASASAGESIGITSDDFNFERGQVMAVKNALPKVTKTFRANVFWMSPNALKKDEKIILKIATQEVQCKIERIEKRINSSSLELLEENAGYLEDTEVGQVVVSAEKPVVIESFNEVEELGRFVLVKDMDISGGGIII